MNSKSWSELTDINTWKESMPESLKAQVLVKAQFEDPEIQIRNQEITKTKTFIYGPFRCAAITSVGLHH